MITVEIHPQPGEVLSKRLVEAMGGVLAVDSRVAKGTTFAVELPETGRPGATAAVPEEVAASAAAERTAGTVLYVEDNQANIQLVEHIVERRPRVSLLVSMQGRQALELARAHRPDLILLDLHLPDLSGEEVLTRLGQDATTLDIPVVVLSADATPGRITRLLAAGARAYLSKPIDVAELLALLDSTLKA
jgi:CheY-like chemotaxis protein